MTVRTTKPVINVRKELAELRNRPKYLEQQFWFEGDGSIVAFTMARGWVPKHVFNAGLLQKEGAGDEYLTTLVDGLYIITFNVAPSNLNDVGVIGVRV